MKHTQIFIIFVAALALFACEKKQVAEKSEVTLSFDYREVDSCMIEFKSTSTPAYIADDLWYRFNDSYPYDSIHYNIGDGFRRFYHKGEVSVSVWYKPGVEPIYDEIRAARDFKIIVKDTIDSTWVAAIPVD